MPTDFTVLTTGLDFLSARMANFPGKRRKEQLSLWGPGQGKHHTALASWSEDGDLLK